MWVFRTIVLVPRPTLLAALPGIVWLLSYLALLGHTGSFLGQPLMPMTVATAAALLSRQFCGTTYCPLRQKDVSTCVGGVCGFAAIFLVLAAPAPHVIQGAYSALLTAWALGILGVIRFVPALVSHLPSIWAGQGEGSPDAMSLVAGSFVLRAVGAWILMMSGEHLLWMLFVTFGGLAIEFLTNWVILLFLYLRRVNN